MLVQHYWLMFSVLFGARMTDATIHLKVPAALKGRWIRASRAEGKRLTDWITEIIEAHMSKQLARIQIPADVSFSDLGLSRTQDGGVEFRWEPIERICTASGLDIELLRSAPEDNITGLLVTWYHAHLQQGGARDATADDLIAEVQAEEAAGQRYSHKPGRA